MKKLILVLAMILIATPAFAAVSVTLSVHDTNKIDINYSYDSNSERPRAFALDVNITPPAKFTAIGNYVKGESKRDPNHDTDVNHIGYGIYPARMKFQLNKAKTGYDVNNYGSPLADDVNDPGASGTGLGTSRVVLEFGSLYYIRDHNSVRLRDQNEPLKSGKLCTLTVDCNDANGDVWIAAKEEEIYRGGIVLEDGTASNVNITGANVSCAPPPPPPPGKATGPTPSNGNPKVTTTTDLSWTAGSGIVDSHDVYFGTASPGAPQGNQTATTFDTATMDAGKTYYWRIDEKNTGGTTTGDVWSFVTECYGNQTNYAEWADAGKPDCWCYPRQCHGDGDGLKAGDSKNGYYYVGAADLTLLQGKWKVKNSPKGPGLSGNEGCGDFDHLKAGDSKNGYYRIGAGDLTILQGKWKVKESPKGPGVDANCVPNNKTP